MTICPFCGHDPYHYVDNGVGMEAVAITCCQPGISFFSREKPETVTLGFDEFSEIGSKLLDAKYLAEAVDEALDFLTSDAEVTDRQRIENALLSLYEVLGDPRTPEFGVGT